MKIVIKIQLSVKGGYIHKRRYFIDLSLIEDISNLIFYVFYCIAKLAFDLLSSSRNLIFAITSSLTFHFFNFAFNVFCYCFCSPFLLYLLLRYEPDFRLAWLFPSSDLWDRLSCCQSLLELCLQYF